MIAYQTHRSDLHIENRTPGCFVQISQHSQWTQQELTRALQPKAHGLTLLGALKSMSFNARHQATAGMLLQLEAMAQL